tara:strand:- start:313 stop:900 length:588 start_codon:yes stop_codon:yes gene_type:complete
MDPITQQLFLGAAGSGVALPEIGDFYEGGYFVGFKSETQNGVATHLLIAAPRASAGSTGRNYPSSTNYNWSNAVSYASGLTINGYSDWFLPGRYELEIAYYNCKPTTASNSGISLGNNAFSVPLRSSAYTSGNPAQTSVAIFQSGGSEAFDDYSHWTGDNYNSSNAFQLEFDVGNCSFTNKVFSFPLRAFRKVAI